MKFDFSHWRSWACTKEIERMINPEDPMDRLSQHWKWNLHRVANSDGTCASGFEDFWMIHHLWGLKVSAARKLRERCGRS